MKTWKPGCVALVKCLTLRTLEIEVWCFNFPALPGQTFWCWTPRTWSLPKLDLVLGLDSVKQSHHPLLGELGRLPHFLVSVLASTPPAPGWMGVKWGASPSRRLQVHPLGPQGRAAGTIQTQPWLSVRQGEARGVFSILRCSRTI